MATKTSRTRRIEQEREIKKTARQMAYKVGIYENNVRRLYAGVKYPDKFLKNSVASAMLVLLSQAADHYIYDLENFCGVKYRDPKGAKLFKEMQTSLDRVITYLDTNSKTRFMNEGLNKEEAGEGVNILADMGNIFEAFGEYLITYCTLSRERWRLDRLTKLMDEMVTGEARASVLEWLQKECRQGLANSGITSEQVDTFLAEGREPSDLRIEPKDPTREATEAALNSNVITPMNIKF